MLSKKKLFLFDIDGTLGIGNELFDGSKELLKYIEDIGGQACFITNNSTKSRAAYVDKFNKWNLKTSEQQFVTSGYLAIQYLKANFLEEKVFVLGTTSFIEDLREAGLTVTEAVEPEISCVMVGYDSEITYEKLCKACEVLSKNDIPYFATNPDLCCPAPFGFIPDCGAICEMLQHSVKKTPIYLGKPNKAVVEICLEQYHFSKAETIVVGDRLYTDIACGIAAGVDTCILFTGEAQPEDLTATEFAPTYAFADVKELLLDCLKDS